jgi:hypothetical protein
VTIERETVRDVNWRSLFLRTWKTIATLLDIHSLLLLLVGGSAATLTATIAQRVGAGLVVVVFGSITAFAAGGLVARWLPEFLRRRRYRKQPPDTKHKLVGGASLTYVIHHSGLPVTVRARVTIEEFGDDLDAHPEPFDMLLRTQPHGGSYHSVELNDAFDMAKTLLAQITELSGGSRDTYLTVHYPGMGDVGCVVHRGHNVLLVFYVTLYVTTPLGVANTTEMFKVSVNQKTIKVWDKEEQAEPARLACEGERR